MGRQMGMGDGARRCLLQYVTRRGVETMLLGAMYDC